MIEILIQRAVPARGIPAPSSLRLWAWAALGEDAGATGELGIRICDEAESRLHNQQYRGRDQPTNVLSFPAEEVAGENLLGDLLICAPVVQREAAEQGKLPRAHWAHMVMHGTLHLLGMDHQDARTAKIMEQRETRLLAAFGFPDPYTSQNTSS